MRTSTKIYIGSIIVGIVAVIFILTNVSYSNVASVFRDFNPWLLVLYLGLSMIVWFMHSVRWQVILKAHRIRVPLYQTFLYRMFGNSIGYITPSARLGGEVVRLASLKRHSSSTRTNLSSILIDKTLELATNGIFFCIGICIVLFTTKVSVHVFIGLLLVMIVFIAAVLLYYYHMLKGKSFLPKLCKRLGISKIKAVGRGMYKVVELEEQMIHFYNKSRRAFLYSILLSGIAWSVMIAEFYVLMSLVGIKPGLMEIFLVFSFVGLAYLIPLPMAIGSLEGSMLFIFAVLGWPAATALGVALVIRIRDTVIALAGLVGLTAYGFKLGRFYEK